MDRGSEAIDDPAELARVRRKARIVHAESLVAALALTALAVALP